MMTMMLINGMMNTNNKKMRNKLMDLIKKKFKANIQIMILKIK